MRWSNRGLLFPSVLSLILLLPAVSLLGQVKAPFLPRYQVSVKGNMTLIANNVLSDSATANYNGTLGNHSLSLVYVDVDSDTGTFNSGNATLTLPAGLICPVVKKIFLYWAAADMEDPGNEPNWEFNKVKLKVPGATSYSVVTADQVIYQGRLEHFYNDPYVCVKDITALVPADPTGLYWVANVKAKQGILISHGGGNTGCSGGWIIVVVYESTSLPQKNIALFDGYVHVATEMSPNPMPFSFSGFQTVPTGTVNVDFLMGSLEGDWDLSGDYCQIQKVDGSYLTMSSALRQTNNFFHSIIGLDGAQFLNRVPASQNTLGFDADKFPIQNPGNTVIGNNQTSATIRMGTNQEIYGMFLVGLAVDVWFPEILTLFTVPAMPGGTGGSVNAGDTVLFHVQSSNNGNDGAQGLVLTTTIPPGLEYLQVAGTLPPGVTSGFNTTSKVLSFSIPDSLVQVGDPPFSLSYKARAITDCILLQDSATQNPTCQVTASYQGVVNAAPQSNLSSTGLTPCGLGNLAPVTFNIIPPPATPVAVNDSSTLFEDIQVTVYVVGNDFDCSNGLDPATLAITAPPHHGTASVLQNTGNILYTPDSNYNGKDTLQYRICNVQNLCDTASVFLAILPVNDPPVVMNESYSLCESTSVSGNILSNDSDPIEQTAMTASLPPATGPTHGTLTWGANGLFTYTPAPGYSGPDQFTVGVCDSGIPLPALCANDTVFLVVWPLITADAGPDLVLCDRTNVQLTGNPPSPGTGTWSQVSGPAPAILTPTGPATVSASGLITGQYVFRYTITSGECVSSDTTVLQNLPPVGPANAGSDLTVCKPDTASVSVFLAAMPPANGAGAWSQKSGPTPAVLHDPADPNTLISGLVSGSYGFEWTVTGAPCPPVSDSITIRVLGPALANAGPDMERCGSNSVALDQATAVNYQSLEWKTSGDGLFNDPSLMNTTYKPGAGDLSVGVVRLILSATSAQPCPATSDTMILRLALPPNVTTGPDGVVCSTNDFKIEGASVSAAQSYFWTTDGQGQLLEAGTLTPTYAPFPGEQGTVTFILHASGQGGCSVETVTGECHLRVILPVVADAGPDLTVEYGKTATLSVTTSAGSGEYTYSWQPVTLLSNSQTTTPTSVPLESSVTFYVTVTDTLSGCSAIDSVVVHVNQKPKEGDESCLVFHNAFTPNGDGTNDTWIIDCIENFPENDMVIFDRWGNQVRTITNYNNTSNVWDGTNRHGGIVPDGTFYYVLTIRNGKAHSGWVFVRGGGL